MDKIVSTDSAHLFALSLEHQCSCRICALSELHGHSGARRCTAKGEVVGSLRLMIDEILPGLHLIKLKSCFHLHSLVLPLKPCHFQPADKHTVSIFNSLIDWHTLCPYSITLNVHRTESAIKKSHDK